MNIKPIFILAFSLLSLSACGNTEKKVNKAASGEESSVNYVSIFLQTVDYYKAPKFSSEPVIDCAVDYIEHMESSYEGSSEAPELEYVLGGQWEITLSDGRKIRYEPGYSPRAVKINDLYYYGDEALTDTMEFKKEITQLSLEEKAARNDSEEEN